MNDGTGTEPEPAALSRQDVFEDYLKYYFEREAEVRPCRDDRIHQKALLFLRRNPDPFTLFPFHLLVKEKCEDQSKACEKHLTAFIKATETLETLCVNLFLQPWRKEIRTLKTFTGAFVYRLLPVLSGSTLQSVLASIGYLPNNDASQSPVQPCVSEFRLSPEASSKQAVQMGFELLLAKVQCHHLLELLEEEQLGPQDWLETLQRREQPARSVDHEMKDHKEEEKEELDKKEVPLDLDPSLALNPQPKPRRYHLRSVDQSVIDMQRTYPDLAFRGRPLVSDQAHKGAVGSNTGLSKRDGVKRSKAGAPADDLNKSTSGINDKNNGRSSTATDKNCCFSDSDENRVDDELSGPQAISLNIAVRGGPKAEPSLTPDKPHSAAQHPAETQSERERVSLAKRDFQSFSSTDDEQDLRELAKRMEQGHKDEEKRKSDRTKDQENHNKERNSAAAKENLRRPEVEAGEVVSPDSSRRAKPSEPVWIKEQKQAAVCPSVTAHRKDPDPDPDPDPKGQTDTFVTFC